MMEPAELAEIVGDQLAKLDAQYIRYYLHGFVSTHPRETIQSVNQALVDDQRYKDAVSRTNAWWQDDPLATASWAHVSAETEASLRLAASWRSSSLAWRSGILHGGTHLGSRKEALTAHDESARWLDRAFVHRNGVAIKAWADPSPWTGEIVAVVAAVLAHVNNHAPDLGPCNGYVVLCSTGRVIDGLPAWPRG